MKAKTIKSTLRAKLGDWVKSITDPVVADAVAKETIITGGSIVSMLTGNAVNDYDCYFRTKETAILVANYYVEKFKENPPAKFKEQDKDIDIRVLVKGDRVRIQVKSAGIASEKPAEDYQYFESQPDEVGEEYVARSMDTNLEAADDAPAAAIDTDKPAYRPVFLSDNAITLSNKIQVVLRFYGDVGKIHENYDFVHCTCYWQSWDGLLVLPQAALEATITKELRYVGSKYPLCSIIRIRKFVARGWHINAGQILKMCMQLNGLNLKDISVLEDQLTGVDAAYFVQILDRLREKQTLDGTAGEPIDSAYLMTIIDRMF